EKIFAPVKNVVTEDERHGIFADERVGYKKSLGDAFRFRLLAIIYRQTPRRTVPEKLPEPSKIIRRRDEAELADSAFDQGRERIIDHRFVIDRLELLACNERERKQAGASAAGQDDAFHARRKIRNPTRKGKLV